MGGAGKGGGLAGKSEELSDRLSQRREEFSDDLDELKDDFQARLEARKAQNRQQLQEWKDAVQALMDKESFGQKRLLKAFPSLRSLQHRAAMDRLRRHQNHS